MIIFMEIMIVTIIALILEERMTKHGKTTKTQWFKRMATIGAIVVLITIGISFIFISWLLIIVDISFLHKCHSLFHVYSYARL